MKHVKIAIEIPIVLRVLDLIIAALPPAHVPPAITVAKLQVNLPITLQPLHLVIAVIKTLAHLQAHL